MTSPILPRWEYSPQPQQYFPTQTGVERERERVGEKREDMQVVHYFVVIPGTSYRVVEL